MPLMRVRTSSRLTLAALGTTLLLAVSACGSSGSTSSAATVAPATTPIVAPSATTPSSGTGTPSGPDATGSAPAGGGAPGGARANSAELQAAANAFTACLREQGVDVQDITMGAGPTGGSAPTGANGSRPARAPGSAPNGSFPGRGNGGGGFNAVDLIVRQLGLDTSDATVSAAVNACTSTVTALVPNGAGGAGSTTTSTVA
ncbi:MAG: hypothetical protein JWM12_1270 [Ilumatobacteraceae bacterium]|jgi:hypothetical protein|nr:hypothetical protein [Ilumatobacteraceae bacterium]